MSYSVLLVEDEPNIVLSLKFVMTQMGFDVRVTGDGETAIEEIAKDVPDLLLLDIMLPRRDGFAVCESVKANPDCKNVKIIMLSAKSRESDREKALKLGADKFITKPFSTRNLKELVSELMGIDAV